MEINQFPKETTIKTSNKYAQNFKLFYQRSSADEKYALRRHAKHCCQALSFVRLTAQTERFSETINQRKINSF
jgi:hypothetical protein